MSSQAQPLSTSEQNKHLVYRWFEEVWNKGRAEAIAEMFADDGIAHGLADDPQNPLRGPKGFLPFMLCYVCAVASIAIATSAACSAIPSSLAVAHCRGPVTAFRERLRGRHGDEEQLQFEHHGGG